MQPGHVAKDPGCSQVNLRQMLATFVSKPCPSPGMARLHPGSFAQLLLASIVLGGLRLRLCLVLGVSCKVDCCCCPLLGVVFVPGDVRPNDDAVPRTPPDMLSGASPAFPTCLLGYVSLFGQALPRASGLAVLTSKERRFVYCLPVLHAFRLPLRSSHKRFARAAAPG